MEARLEPMDELEKMDSVALIAGNGPLPLVFAREAKKAGKRIIAVAHLGETDPRLEEEVQDIEWIHVGELERLLRFIKSRGAGCALFLGGVDKKKVLKNMRLDERALRLLGRLGPRGDDTLLGALASELEEEGIKVVSSARVLARWLCPEGILSRRSPGEREIADITLGIQVLDRVGSLDIGQTVVVKEGVILAVEAIEGTDEAIRRGGALGGSGAVVVKGSKPGQDMRFDVPVVGPRTVNVMRENGATVLALEAHRTIIVDPGEVKEAVDEWGMVLLGWRRSHEP